MNDVTGGFTFAAAVLLLTLPRHLASIPLVLAAGCVTGATVFDIGPASFTVLRILVGVGVARVVIRGESVSHGVTTVDRLVIAWAVLLLATSVFHGSGSLVFRAGLAWDQLGSYLLLRVFLRGWDDVTRAFRTLCLVLVPVSILMLVEQSNGYNPFSVFGEALEATMRDGVLRARGPFAHPILAGTVGATCLPMALSLWRTHRVHALVGIGAATAIVFASRSSGPLLMAAFAVGGLLLWPVREQLPAIRAAAVATVIALHLVMKAPVYFLIARIDVTGGSQGWHRAQLIHESLAHLDEWWLVGTGYTRHWMPSGIHASAAHTDITNHLLYQGVHGGLPLLALFIAVLVAAFRSAGRFLARPDGAARPHQYTVWVLGTILAAHVGNFLSITLFDQSIVFFYLVLAAIGVTAARPAHVATARPGLPPRGGLLAATTVPASPPAGAPTPRRTR